MNSNIYFINSHFEVLDSRTHSLYRTDCLCALKHTYAMEQNRTMSELIKAACSPTLLNGKTYPKLANLLSSVDSVRPLHSLCIH